MNETIFPDTDAVKRPYTSTNADYFNLGKIPAQPNTKLSGISIGCGTTLDLQDSNQYYPLVLKENIQLLESYKTLPHNWNYNEAEPF